MAHGGRRPGSGRKPKAINGQEPPVKAAESRLRDRLPEIVDVVLSLAIDDRDLKAAVYCIDRVLGKPAQPIELDVQRAADRLASATGADAQFLIRRAQQLAAENASAEVTG